MKKAYSCTLFQPTKEGIAATKMLMKAGADLDRTRTGLEFNDTRLDLTTFCLKAKVGAGARRATEEDLHSLEVARRMLLRVEAVYPIFCALLGCGPRMFLCPAALPMPSAQERDNSLISQAGPTDPEAKRDDKEQAWALGGLVQVQ